MPTWLDAVYDVLRQVTAHIIQQPLTVTWAQPVIHHGNSPPGGSDQSTSSSRQPGSCAENDRVDKRAAWKWQHRQTWALCRAPAGWCDGNCQPADHMQLLNSVSRCWPAAPTLLHAINAVTCVHLWGRRDDVTVLRVRSSAVQARHTNQQPLGKARVTYEVIGKQQDLVC